MTEFTRLAPLIMNTLIADFSITKEDAAAIVGNLAHETLGFTKLQEISPVVAGSRGGYGWAQWTGPRRRAYEAYCTRNGYDPASDKANYKYLFVELTTTEKAALPAVRGAVGLKNKTVAFEQKFERAGVKHYDSRVSWAEKALALFDPKAGTLFPEAAPAVSPTNLIITSSFAGGALAAIVAVLQFFGII